MVPTIRGTVRPAFAFRAYALALGLSAAAAAGSCTMSEAPAACAPGRAEKCTGSNGCTGQQVCADDGSRFLPCVCKTSMGATVVIEAGADGRLPNLLGAPCTANSDCWPLLHCLTSSSKTIFEEGPANGLCVADCAKATDTCARLDPSSTCRVFDNGGTPNSTADDTAYCMRGCTVGAGSGTGKCFERPDMGCIPLGTATTKGACIPTCRNDADCSPRFCDLASGLCADGPRTGSSIGSPCSASSKNTCSGFCRGAGVDYTECSGYCSNGQVACGEIDGPPFDQLCLAPVAAGPWAGGDFGYCRKLCDCNADCGRTDAVCSPLPAAVATAAGRKGECRSATTDAGDPRPGLACP